MQFNELQECYLQKRRQLVDQVDNQVESQSNVMQREGFSSGLSDFQSVLTTFTRYRCDNEIKSSIFKSYLILVFSLVPSFLLITKFMVKQSYESDC